jgi:hypothetical protein
MPFKSKAQERWMFAAEKRGEVKPGMAEEWAAATPSQKALPQRVGNKEAVSALRHQRAKGGKHVQA